MKKKPKPSSKTLLFIMKITLIHMLLTSVTIVCASALDSSGQGVLERKVTVRFENAKVKDVLSEIQKITGVNFTYRSHLLKNIGKVTLSVTDAQLGDILSQVFASSIDYEVVGKQIILTETVKETDSEEIAMAGEFLALQVSGKITDEAGAAIPGVNVIEKGTTNGTATDAEGKYNLLVGREKLILNFSFICYAT